MEHQSKCHYHMDFELNSAAPGGVNMSVIVDMLANKATVAEAGAELGKLVEAIIKKEG